MVSGFAKDFFTYGEDSKNLGSRVTLAGVVSHECEIFPDGSHETQIMCYTK